MNAHLDFLAACQSLGCEATAQVPLSEYTTFRIGGAAEYFVSPDSPAQIGEVIRLCRDYGLPYFVLGKGSNLLVADHGVRGVIISTQKLDRIELLPEGRIRCESGVSLLRLCRFALDHALTGLEFAYGIPGT
ncbi:MAG: FAD-binding protein, partial [Clostridia bacterium]|nr:FAD-binding protein [Clostridia bacterium]